MAGGGGEIMARAEGRPWLQAEDKSWLERREGRGSGSAGTCHGLGEGKVVARTDGSTLQLQPWESSRQRGLGVAARGGGELGVDALAWRGMEHPSPST